MLHAACMEQVNMQITATKLHLEYFVWIIWKTCFLYTYSILTLHGHNHQRKWVCSNTIQELQLQQHCSNLIFLIICCQGIPLISIFIVLIQKKFFFSQKTWFATNFSNKQQSCSKCAASCILLSESSRRSLLDLIT